LFYLLLLNFPSKSKPTWPDRFWRRPPHRLEEYLGAVFKSQDQFDLRSFLRHLVDVNDRQRRHILQELVYVRTMRRRTIQLVLCYVVVEMFPCRARWPVIHHNDRSQRVKGKKVKVNVKVKVKVKVWTLVIAPLTWVTLVTSSALQSRKWQLIGMSQVIYITLFLQYLTLKALRNESHSVTFKLHHTYLYLLSVHQMALPLNCDGVHLIAPYYSSVDPERMKAWAGLVGEHTADGLPTQVVTRQASAAGWAQGSESSPVKDRHSYNGTLTRTYICPT